MWHVCTLTQSNTRGRSVICSLYPTSSESCESKGRTCNDVITVASSLPGSPRTYGVLDVKDRGGPRSKLQDVFVENRTKRAVRRHHLVISAYLSDGSYALARENMQPRNQFNDLQSAEHDNMRNSEAHHQQHGFHHAQHIRTHLACECYTHYTGHLPSMETGHC